MNSRAKNLLFWVVVGLFMLLGGWWIQGIVSLLVAIPFFAVMRLLEKHAAASADDLEAHPTS